MPRTLFEPVVAVPARNRRPIGTVLISIALHAVALAVLASFELARAFDFPDVGARVFAYIPPPPPALPPAPAPPPRPTPPPPDVMPAAVVDIAPTVAPDQITPEPPGRPVAPASPLPAGFSNVGSFDPGLLGAAPGASRVVLGTPPVPQGPVRIGGEIQPPARTVYVAPAYPLFARTARVEGDVVLDATIDAKGVVTDVKVRRSIPALDQAAIDAVSRWRYAPTRLNGVPVAVVMQVTVTFRLR